ncbi:hypothetical protein [Bosea sp. RAC05]|uniref:hypothetical protein n=1 Tax=Bosea sp. RAC05 TaxID=1842539 RepID=UPI00083D1F64|nr:hypothetical protein [Bosea sp. RAC05]AOG05771.1 hypothetical protein BSY19_2680 [Bosea sp. RAC05]
MAARSGNDGRIFSRLEPSCHWPNDDELGLLILGPKRAHLWPAIVKVEERAGFPRVSTLYGGREWAAIVEFYERRRRNVPAAVMSLDPTDDERAKENWGPAPRKGAPKA